MTRRARRLLHRIVERLRTALGNVRPVARWPWGAAAVLYLVWRSSGGALPLFALRTMILLLVGSYLWTRWMVRAVDCICDADRREITRGEELRLTLRFENEGFVPIPSMMARTQVPGWDGPWTVISSVPGLRSRVIQIEERMKEHGNYRLGPVEFAVTDPFGWFRGTRTMYGNRSVTVYPRILPVTGDQLPLRRPFGRLRTRIRSFADPSHLADIRPMVPGDNPRHIHWPTSARMGEPYVREFELTASGEVNVVLDLSASPDTYPEAELRELAFDVAAGLAARCLQSELAVGLTARGRTTDYSLRAAKGTAQMRAIMKSLAYSQADCKMPLELILRRVGYAIGSGSTILVVTGAVTPRLTTLLRSLMHAGLGVAVFSIKAKRSGVFEGSPEISRDTTSLPFPFWTVTPQSNMLNLSGSRLRDFGSAIPLATSGAGGDSDE
ncbi:MAG: DUF58 domain-containing protein [Clostridia bacterium]